MAGLLGDGGGLGDLGGSGYSDEGGPQVDLGRISTVVLRDGHISGPLHKKGGTRSGLLNRHNWALRTFWVRASLGAGENYELSYHKGELNFASGDEAALRRTAKGVLPLAGCSVVEATTSHRSKGVGFEFQLFGAREGGAFEMYAETLEERAAWCAALRYVIAVAAARDRWLRGERSASLGLAAHLGVADDATARTALSGAVKSAALKNQAATMLRGKKAHSSAAAYDAVGKGGGGGAAAYSEEEDEDDGDDEDRGERWRPSPDGVPSTLRVEVDAESYPPQSGARAASKAIGRAAQRPP